MNGRLKDCPACQENRIHSDEEWQAHATLKHWTETKTVAPTYGTPTEPQKEESPK
jgi:hypothetical protein